MKKIILFFFISLSLSNTHAQRDTLRLSLPEAVQYGLASRFDKKADSLNSIIAENSLIKAKKELLPDLSANGKMTYYNDIQPSIIPAGYLGFTENRKVAIGMKNNTAFSLDLSYTAYKPGLYADIRISRNNWALMQERNSKKEQDIRIDISESYYNVLLKKFQYEIAEKSERRFREYYELASGKLKNGALIESDVMQAELDYKSALANTEKSKQNYMLSLENLKYKIHVDPQSVIILSDSLMKLQSRTLSCDPGQNPAFNRSELNQLVIDQRGNELQLKKSKQNYLPAVSIFANYTKLFQGPEFNYSNSFYWAPVNYIGIKLSLPVTGSFKNASLVRENKLKIVQADFNLKQKKADVSYEIQQALTRLSNAENNIVQAGNNYYLSQQVYRLKAQQYSLGTFSYEKLLDTEKSVSMAEQDYITAIYEFLIARINYEKALGSE